MELKHRYPWHIEEDITDVEELINLTEEEFSNEKDHALEISLNHLKQIRQDFISELNSSNKYYKLTAFDMRIESTNNKVPSVKEITLVLNNLQELFYSLAESTKKKVEKGSKFTEFVRTFSTIGISKASPGSLKLELKPINQSQTQLTDPHMKIVTDKLNLLLDCGSDNSLLKEQANDLGSQPIYKYKSFLKGIEDNNLTISLFNEVKPENYETQILNPKFAKNVKKSIDKIQIKKKKYYRIVEGVLEVINGRKKEININIEPEKTKGKYVALSFDDNFNDILGDKYKQIVKVKILVCEKHSKTDGIIVNNRLIEFLE
jgi:hypothetical protein